MQFGGPSDPLPTTVRRVLCVWFLIRSSFIQPPWSRPRDGRGTGSSPGERKERHVPPATWGPMGTWPSCPVWSDCWSPRRHLVSLVQFFAHSRAIDVLYIRENRT